MKMRNVNSDARRVSLLRGADDRHLRLVEVGNRFIREPQMRFDQLGRGQGKPLLQADVLDQG